MDLPVIETPVFPRWVWIEEITYSHIPIATFITAVMLLAPIFETIGHCKKDLRYDRLAKGWIWFAMILFSPGAALGTGIPIFIIGAYPEFWHRWANLFFWPLMAQFCFFLLEVGFLFFGYYLTWERWKNRKRLHIAMGAIAALWGYLVQMTWDGLGSYMLTPGRAALPGVDQPTGWSGAALFNPSFPFLLAHRTFGNFSYVMLLCGGIFALRYMRQKKAEEKAYLGWAANKMFCLGFLFFFAQPVIGWFYARTVQAQAPVAFHAIMGGHASPYFALKMGLILVMVVLATLYLALRYRSTALRAAITAGLAVVGVVVLHHPPLDWIAGSAIAWRVVSTGVVAGLIAAVWLLNGRGDARRRRWQWAMFVAGLAATLAFALGGFVRERSKSPDTVYGQIVKPEATQFEKDRYLTYRRCLGCHMDEGPNLFDRYEKKDWADRVRIERRRPGVRITDDEARRITRFLQEHYR